MMRRLLILLSLFPVCLLAQNVNINPTISPASFKPNEEITVTYDVTGTALASLDVAYIWMWIPGKYDATSNKNPASSDPSATDKAKFTKVVSGGSTKFSLTLVPQDFFSQPICLETQLGMLIKGNNWSDGQSQDATPIPTMTPLSSCYVVELKSPVRDPAFISAGSDLVVEATSSESSTFTLSVDGMQIDQGSALTEYSFSYAIPQSSGLYPVELSVVGVTGDTVINFSYLVVGTSEEVVRPDGTKPGINYHDGDPTSVTLCLLAPDKEYVFVRGDFNEWAITPDYQLKQDGEYFWIELNNLISGQEYAYQYIIGDGIPISDPFTDKILDGYNDSEIPESTYPNLKVLDNRARSTSGDFNLASVFQTNQTPYNWVVNDFVKPPKEELVIYELLLRDFFDDGDQSYQNLIDTVGYFKKLGINAIELMPITEFGSNNSWGYNPTFMFAPDKFYGTKNKLKEFVDVCHQNGIAVIMDMVLNQQDRPNPYLLMDFDFVQNKPNATNKFFNVTAPHPFSVFYDMNHESLYTQAYVDTITYYWINEYKIDGYRFDLSKGFTQKSSNDDGVFRLYDPSRIAILKRMADKIWSHTPEAYVILEHFAENGEEKELAEYRLGEGMGMMLWGGYTAHNAYLQSAMGYSSDSDFSSVYHGTRGWSTPHVVGYMESHDEERMMFKNISFGNGALGYNVKDEVIALERIKAATTVFYTVPGPKMLWQFGELAYDYPINYCENGTINNACRVDPKPVRWDYRENPSKYWLYLHISDLLQLRAKYDLFRVGTATISASSSSLIKQIILKNVPYVSSPTATGEMNGVVAVNFDVSGKDVTVEFPHDGVWYDYYAGGDEVTVTGGSVTIPFAPGAYKIYTDVAISRGIVLSAEDNRLTDVVLYPNPSSGTFSVEGDNVLRVSILSADGREMNLIQVSDKSWDIKDLPAGLYVVQLRTASGVVRKKLIKE